MMLQSGFDFALIRREKWWEKTTFKKAAKKILEENNGEPLHYNEITKRALEQNLIQTKGETPDQTLLKNMSEDIYFKMISDKTASLISASCKLGYISTSEDEKKTNIEKFGEFLGILQIYPDHKCL